MCADKTVFAPTSVEPGYNLHHHPLNPSPSMPRYGQKSQKKSRNPENLKSPQKFGRFDLTGSPVALFVAEISLSEFFVTRTDGSWKTTEELRILGV